MHELSVVQAFVSMAERYAAQSPDEKVSFITIEIGEMTGIETKYFRSYYPEVAQGTLIEGSELRIEEKDALAFCRECGHTFNPAKEGNTCLGCGKSNFEIIEGDKILLKQIGFET